MKPVIGTAIFQVAELNTPNLLNLVKFMVKFLYDWVKAKAILTLFLIKKGVKGMIIR